MPLAESADEPRRGDARHTDLTRPLVIDADRTLISCDLTFEMLVTFLKLEPRRLPELLGWIRKGRHYLQHRLLERVPIDVHALPVNQSLLRRAESEAASGRPVFLAASVNAPLLGGLEHRFPFVAGIIAPDTPGATVTADALARRFPDGFDYAGCTAADLHIWQLSSSAILVGASAQVERRAAALVPISATIRAPSRLQGVFESLRLYQWIKNLLVFAPLILGGELGNVSALLATIMAFLALSLVASSTYLINDVLDAADDRQHWSKRNRPIASGRLPASTASAWSLIGVAAGLALAAWVSWQTLGMLLLYLGLTLSYSWGLKRLPLVDGLVLAIQFTLRLALGVAAAQVPPSPWLFVFSMFLFTSLSLAKRYTELGRLSTARGTKVAGRGYRAEDAPLVLAVGVSAALGAVIILILYIIEDAFRQTFYGSTFWLWGFPPVIFLLTCRMWLVTVRGEMNDDPVRFMLADRASQYLLCALVVCFAFAWLA